MNNIIGLAGSMVYILTVLGLATIVARVSKGASETSRKLVHILVGNWVFFIPLFTDLWAILLVPFTFIIINSLSLKYNLISAMERNDDSLGTVYYAISMFVLSGAGFALGWNTLPFVGLLTMAYGDGLAAVVGQKWGKKGRFSFAPEKTGAGSMMVAISAFIITLTSILVFQGTGNLRVISTPLILLIALLTSILSVFIELTGENGCDNISLPFGSALFASLALQFADTGFFIYLAITLTILLVAYKFKSISPDGIVAAILTAITLYTLSGPLLGTSLLVFFILGSAISKITNEKKEKAETLHEHTGPRNWIQVLSNSIPACVLAWMGYIYSHIYFIPLLGFAVFSAAAADTFSSEIGMMSKGRVFNILTGKPIPRGLSGGVSWVGLLAGLLGSFLLSLFALPQFGVKGMIFVTVLGFFGSIFDSLIGIFFQSQYLGDEGQLQDRASNDKPVKGFKLITNNAVNLISLSLVTLFGHIICIFIIY